MCHTRSPALNAPAGRQCPMPNTDSPSLMGQFPVSAASTTGPRHIQSVMAATHPYSSSIIIRLQIRGFTLSRIPEVYTLYLRKEAQPMDEPDSGIANKSIDRILELSADAHIRRRGTVRDSAKFHNLTGAVVAYGKVLAVLTALQQREESHAIIGQRDVSGCVAGVS